MTKHIKPFARLFKAAVASLPLLIGLEAQAQVKLDEGLVAYWPFETNFEDQIGIFDGTPAGTEPITFVDGKPGFGKAISLNGEDQEIEITGGEPDDLAFAEGSMTIAGWFKVGAFDTAWQALVAKGEGTSWRVHRRGDESGFAHAGGIGEGPAGGPVNDGLWHHFAAISDAAATSFGTALYIDGEIYTQFPTAPVLGANGLRMMIGENPAAQGREWEGEIDDIAIWNRPLLQAEVEALYNNGAGKPLSAFFTTSIEVLGIGAESLVGSDLTDPENDGNEAAGAADPSWNWVGITSSHESFFDGAEGAFNIFDNTVGGGASKWCCDDPTPGNPVWVAVQFPRPVSINRFTITSGNDSPDRDPTDWAIQGSDDGATWTDIYHFNDTTVPWTDRNQVVSFTLADGSTPYRHIRYIAYATPGTLHQINEVELFGNFGGATVGYVSGIRTGINNFGFTLNDDGTSVIDLSSVRATVDGVNIPLGTLTKTDGKATVLHTFATPFAPGSTHTYSITATDGNGNQISSAGEFTTAGYALLTAADKVTPDTSKPGFVFNVHQNAAFQANDNIRPVEQLAGLLGLNQADPNVQGPALAPATPPSNPNLPFRYEIPTVINLNQDVGGAAGNIPDDLEIPGIPGVEFSTDGIAAEIITYIELPAGLTTMIFNSDDGFRTTAGQVNDVFNSQLAGQFVGGRGAADTAFTVYAESAGVYPFRTIWYEGGGGANLEWLTVKADGTKVLINDEANGGVKAYRAVTGNPPTAIVSVSPGRNATRVAPTTPIEVVIREGSAAVDNASIRFTINGTEVTPTVTKTGSDITARFTPTTPYNVNATNNLTIKFTAGGTERTAANSFFVPNATLDKVSSRPALILGTTAHTANSGGRTSTAGDYAIDFGRTGPNSLLVPDGTFLNSATAAGDDTLSVSFWVKKYDIASSSAFWFASPGSPSGQRGFQAHTPWSDNTIYFDSSGCCDADVTRISKSITELPTYTDLGWWTNNWRHFAFVKNGAAKQIYIDGELFHEGAGDPLRTDFTRLWIGAQGSSAEAATANSMHGLIDDFAIFGNALTAAQVTQIAGGAAPTAVPATAQLLAYWDFNDPPAPPVASPSISVTRSGTGITLSWPATATGFKLFSSATVDGDYTEVTGVTGNSHTVTPLTGNRFYVLKQ